MVETRGLPFVDFKTAVGVFDLGKATGVTPLPFQPKTVVDAERQRGVVVQQRAVVKLLDIR